MKRKRAVSAHPPQRRRILQLVGGLQRAGAETWLMHVLRSIDREQFAMDFVVHTTEPAAYDDEVRALGSRVIPCLEPHHPQQYARAFREIIRSYGPYDVVHSHVHHYSGYVLRLAHHAAVPGRIAHSHLDSAPSAEGGILRSGYRALTASWIRRYATAGLACSPQAAVDLFGPRWEADSRFRLLYCGIDLAPFHAPVDRLALRASLGIPPDAFVVGHVGRFAYQKNHRFLIEIASALAKQTPNLHVLLVGTGELRGEIEAQVAGAGLAARVTFTGSRPDVPHLLRAMDAFLFPSRFEGLGLALVEAQAAGLPCVIAAVIPPEADVVPGLVRRVPLDAPLATWAAAVTATRECDTTPAEALRRVAASPFNIATSVRQLERQYAHV